MEKKTIAALMQATITHPMMFTADRVACPLLLRRTEGKEARRASIETITSTVVSWSCKLSQLSNNRAGRQTNNYCRVLRTFVDPQMAYSP